MKNFEDNMKKNNPDTYAAYLRLKKIADSDAKDSKQSRKFLSDMRLMEQQIVSFDFALVIGSEPSTVSDMLDVFTTTLVSAAISAMVESNLNPA